VAVFRGYLNQALVVLGSATPSLESFANTEKGKYQLIELKGRYGEATLPLVLIQDMRQEHKEGNWTLFSRLLKEKIKDRLLRAEQIILLLNRRGFAPQLLCKHCGYIARCPYCDVSTTYHVTHHRLCCHYCGYQVSAPDVCPKCGGSEIRFQGAGVQKVEKEIAELFPQARIARMDTDSTTRRKSHEMILQKFASGEVDILIGTQMVSKGIHFPNVTLVGVISADTALNMPDFRASENTFQLLCQVAGRSGRGDKKGEVILQTYSPLEPSIVYAGNQDFHAFYEMEKKGRQALLYPPFSRLIQIILSHSDFSILSATAIKLSVALKEQSRTGVRILGPAPAPLSKQKGRFRMLILLKAVSSAVLHELIKNILKNYKGNPDVRMVIDVDPVYML
jgi:primosomal protein N' (replication factor Y)